MQLHRTVGAAIVIGILFVPSMTWAQDPIARARPEEVGMSSERLALIGKAVNAEIAREQLPGAVLAISRRGKLVFFEAFGHQDKAAGVPMTTDSIFSVASMTKPMVAVAALTLYEQGRLLMDDPLSKYFSKFADMKVAVMDANNKNIVDKVPAVRAITIQDLFRHTSGLIYGGRGTTAVHKLYPSSSSAAATTMSGAEFLDRLSTMPLLHQPGMVWDYGFGLDVLALVVESMTEQTMGRYLEQQVWKPLGMVDTAFTLPADKMSRYAKPFPADPVTGLPQAAPPLQFRFDCGGGCAVSTAAELPALRADAHEQGHLWPRPHPGSQDRRIHAVEPARARRQEPHRECRSNARRLRLWPWVGGSYHGRHRAHAGLGRRFLLAGRNRHQLVG